MMWQFWIDVGGTFTDCFVLQPDGKILVHKLLSSGVTKGKVGEGSSQKVIVDGVRARDPEDFYRGFRVVVRRGEKVVDEGIVYANSEGKLYLESELDAQEGDHYELIADVEAPVLGIRYLLKGVEEAIDVRLGTTRGTNALLERKGANTAFVTTKGFGDILCIGYQNRPKLFALNIKESPALYSAVCEIEERVDAHGEVLQALDEKVVEEQLMQLKREGIDTLAICLLFSYRNSTHELLVRQVAEKVGFTHISVSSELVPLQKIVGRGDTTVVDAYLTPLIRDYVDRIQKSLPACSLKMMTSAGGLVDAHSFVGKESVLSGPAGGVVGCVEVAKMSGIDKVLGLDMGGTSTDVCRYDGHFEYRFETDISGEENEGGARLFTPMLNIETVASGGGSICWFDGELPRVGPQSAGADPGPACYGKGGPLTITDLNVYLGRILPDNFPFSLHLDAIEKRLDEILRQIPKKYTKEELALGFLEIANSLMANAIKKISLARGYDPREYALVAFGGAAPQHACAIAAELSIQTVLIHPYASLLSAYGIGCADIKHFRELAVNLPCDNKVVEELESQLVVLEEELENQVRAEGAEELNGTVRLYELRYRGQDWTLIVSQEENLRDAFEKLHLQRYGFIYPGRDIEIHAIRLECTGSMRKFSPVKQESCERKIHSKTTSRTCFSNMWSEIPWLFRAELQSGDRLAGPAIIAEPFSSVVIEPGWKCAIDGFGICELKREGVKEKKITEELDPINLELFNHKFTSIAEEMGETLQMTALSVNVKERLDFSCALFTPEGDLVVNAPHIPVHLGGMSDCIKCLIEDVPLIRPGDVFITNDPFRGGSHLPDVTVITPVFAHEDLIFFTASRAHHAEIGGIAPGSMPPFAKNLAEEGVLIKTFRFHPGKDEKKLRRLLESAPFPSRAIDDNLADIHAQIAANHLGAQKLLELVDAYGYGVVHAYMGYIQQAAHHKMLAALKRLPEGTYSFEDHLDNDSRIKVSISLDHDSGALVDFSGTSGVDAGNFNANPSIVTSALMYCFRCLIQEDIPLNSGILIPLKAIVPENCLLNPPVHKDPTRCAAVGAGNVETSQRVVDVIFGALGVVAASQGTMNNLLFGSAEGRLFSYYETIGGGAGAGPSFHGTSGVHTHMTNTLLTDPEVFESRFPIRLERFSLRPHSGGKGKFHGGDGLWREITFLEAVQVSLVTSRRKYAPYGLQGGESGEKGENKVKTLQGVKTLPYADEFEMQPGETLIIKTPGGGGYGSLGS